MKSVFKKSPGARNNCLFIYICRCLAWEEQTSVTTNEPHNDAINPDV